MPSARTIKTRNGKYYKSNAESIRSSEPLVSNIRLIQSAKGEPLVSNLVLIQSPKGEPLISNNYFYSSNSESSNIIIILGETRLSHSLAKPDCYARSNSRDNCCIAYMHLSPTLLPGKLRTKRSTAVVQTVTASVTVWLRETSCRKCTPGSQP